MKIPSSVSSPTGTRSCCTIGITLWTLTNAFNWAVVLSYDAQFHHKCTMQGLPFSAFDQQLYVTMLGATAAKVSTCRCFRCQCFDHKVIDCPYPLGALLEKDLVSKRAAQSQKGWGTHQKHQQQCSFPQGSGPQLPTVFHQGWRSASSTSPTHAPSPTGEGPMSAGTVSRSTQLQSVVLQVQPPVNLDKFKHYLACHLEGSGVRACCRVYSKG